MASRIAVIGAGIAGLSAGYHLKRAGFDPVIFEKESFVGGRMSSDLEEGFVIDKGAYMFPGSYKSLRPLLRELGLENSLIKTPLTSSTYYGNKEYKIKLGSFNDFLKYKLISFKDKKNLIKLFLYAKTLSKTIDLGNPNEKMFALEKESAAEYLLKHYNEDLLEKIAYPIFCERYLGVPENNSKIALFSSLGAFQKLVISGSYAFAKGMGMVPENLKKGLDVRLKTPVLGIRPVNDEGPYQVNIGGSNPEALMFDAVIVAVPPPLVPKLLHILSEELEAFFRNMKYAPSIVMGLAADQEYADTSMIYNMPRTEFNVLGTVLFDKHKGPERVPEGKSLVTAILSEEASRALFSESEEKIRARVLTEIDILFPGFSNKFLFSKIYRWEHGAVQLTPGNLSRYHTARNMAEKGFHNIYFATDGFYYSGIETAFRAGQRAGNRILDKRQGDF